ncbi:MAG TPA: hypothetical protein PLZ15_04620 [Melioribacteraceae bacterium]|nr:hypothetical protein [Melioribacteraceae bacterium]
MFTRKQFHQFIPVFAALLLTVQTVHSGDDGKKTVSVKYLSYSGNSEINRKFAGKLSESLKKENFEITEKAEVELLIITSEMENTNQIFVTVVFMQALPKEIIEFNKKHETFYEHLKDKSKLPQEGKFIRELVTEEVISQYRNPVGFHTAVINKDLFDDEFGNLLKEIIERGLTKVCN